MPYTLKKPYPALLKSLIQYTIDENRPDVLRNILMDCYSNEQLSFFKTDKALTQKIIDCLNLESKYSLLAPNSKIDILQKIRKLSPSSTKQTMMVEKSINARMTHILISTNIGNVKHNEDEAKKAELKDNIQKYKPAFFNTGCAIFSNDESGE